MKEKPSNDTHYIDGECNTSVLMSMEKHTTSAFPRRVIEFGVIFI